MLTSGGAGILSAVLIGSTRRAMFLKFVFLGAPSSLAKKD
jgi:hypothetical protein